MNEPVVKTSIVIPARVWELLRALAAGRALQAGGKPSMGAVVSDLVEAETERRQRKDAARG